MTPTDDAVLSSLPATVRGVARALGLSRSTAYRWLELLRRHGLVDRRYGPWVYRRAGEP